MHCQKSDSFSLPFHKTKRNARRLIISYDRQDLRRVTIP